MVRTVDPYGFLAVNFAQETSVEAVAAKIFADSSDLSFRVGYRSADGAVTEYPASESTSSIIGFNFGTYYPNIEWKGMAVWNASGSSQDVTFTAVNAAGGVMGQFQKTMPADSRLACLLDSPGAFGPGFDWLNCIRVLVSGAGQFAGVNMSGEGLTRLLLTPAEPAPTVPGQPPPTATYQVIAWNDLGMHCMDSDYSIFSILPPYNNMWAQVIRLGPDPAIVTSGVTVTYRYENNTTSVGKTNFWQYAQVLFGVSLPPDIGLTGRGVSGTMTAGTGVFNAEGIPLTQFYDDLTSNPYQTAIVEVRDAQNNLLAETRTISGVSTEMHCSNCHNDRGVEGISTGNYRTNILTLHDREEETSLMAHQPVLCASCHPDPILGTGGTAPVFSRAIHGKHAEAIPQTLDGCYDCHPGPTTQCLRGAMFSAGLTCVNCHGTMSQLASSSRTPWMNEPDCGQCHAYGSQPGQLYRHSTGHGGVYCEACHGSTHAEFPSTLAADNAQSIRLQGYDGPVGSCQVCHTDGRSALNPHVAITGKVSERLTSAH